MSQSLGTKITEDDRLCQIARYTPGVIYQFRMRPDGSSCFPYASDGLLMLHGVSPAEVFEDSTEIFSFIHPEDIDRLTQAILESAANMTPLYCQYRVNLPEDRQLWLLCHSTPQREADGSTLWHGYIQDITESKTTEIALQASENKFRSIIENLNDMVYIINADASFSYVSPQFQEVTGYELGELLNDSFAKLVHPEDLSICVDALHRSFQGEKIRGVEYRTLHKDGNYYWHSSNVSALRNDDGEVVACLGVARYVHEQQAALRERKQAEKSLQETNSLLHSVLETIPDFFFAKDLEGRHIAVNSNLARFFGKSVAEVIGKTDAELLPPDVAKKIMAKDREIMSQGITERFEEIVPKNESVDTYYLTVKTPLLDAQGNISGVIGIAQDITDRKQAEMALEENHIRLELALKVANIGSWDWNPQTNQVAFSTQWKAILGYADHEIENSLQEWESRVHPDDLPFVYENIGQHIRGETSFYQTEHRLRSKDGSYKWIVDRGQIAERDEQGNPVRFIGINFDISDRKATEEALQASEEKMRSFFDLCPLGILLNDMQGHFVETNRAMQAIVGYSLEELNQLSYWDLTPEKYAEDEARQLESLNTLGYYGPYQKEYIHKNGSLVPVELRGVLITARDGQQYISSIITDISEQQAALRERKAAEAALAESEAQNRAILQSIPDIMFRVNKSGVYLGYSTSTTLFDLGNTQSIGTFMGDYLSPEHYQRHKHHMDIVLETKQIQIYEQELEIAGRIQHEEVRIVPIEDKEEVLFMIRDIGDRKAAETQLKEVSERLSLALKSGKIGCWEWDIVQNILVWDDRMYELYGVDTASHRDLAYDVWAHGLHPDDRDASEQLIQQALSGQAEFNPEFRVVHPDGSIHFIKAFGLVQRDAEGNPQRMIGINLDISDRKQAEMLLQQSQKRYETLAEASPIGVYLTDAKGDCLYVNQTWSQATGLTKEEALGPDWSRTLHPEDRDRVFQEWYETALLRQPFQSEYRFLRPDNSIAWVIGQALPLIDQAGEIEGYVGTVTDISDRKAAEAALSEYANRQTLLNQLVHQIRNSLDLDAVIVTTIQAIRDLLDIDACGFAWYLPNTEPPIWEIIQEAKIAELPSHLGCYSPTFVGPIDQIIFNQEILRVDDAAQYPEPIHRAFLETIHCQSEILLPIHTHSHRVGVIICTHHHQVRPWTDSEIELLKAISNQLAIAINQAELYAESQSKSQELQTTLQELQRTQTQMIQSEKMSSLGQLVGGIAHEVNNPVSFIYGNIQPATDYIEELVDLVHLYQEQYPEPPQVIVERLEEINLEYLIHDFSRLLESMKNGAARIRDIIKSLRTFSRLDEEGCKTIDIHENIDSTLVVLQSRFNGRDGKPEIQLIKNYGDLPGIECYSGLLNQVFVNLLMNAIDSIESRTAIEAIDSRAAIEQRQNSIEPSCNSKYQGVITITTSLSSSNQAIISIQDNGCGMDAQTQEKIFNPFFTTKPIGQGTGMGLAISYQIMTENHQGNISVNSTPGEGTEFVITMPIKQTNTCPIIIQ